MTEAAVRPVVVCVDDEPAILGSLKRLFRHESFEFLTTEKPDAALTWILQKKASLVISDQRMPAMLGIDLLELVKVCSPSTIRVLLTGQSDLTGIMKLGKIEAIQQLLRKPWDDDVLKRVIRDLLEKGGARSGTGPPPIA